MIIVVAKDVGVQFWRRRRAEGAAAFAVAYLGVDPIVGKELRGQLPKGGIKGFERFKNELLGLCIAKIVRFFFQRRVLIVKRNSWKPEKLGFETEIILR